MVSSIPFMFALLISLSSNSALVGHAQLEGVFGRGVVDGVVGGLTFFARDPSQWTASGLAPHLYYIM
jgi:hypothetical protein